MPAHVLEDFQALTLRRAMAPDKIVKLATDHVRHVFLKSGFRIFLVTVRMAELDGMS